MNLKIYSDEIPQRSDRRRLHRNYAHLDESKKMLVLAANDKIAIYVKKCPQCRKPKSAAHTKSPMTLTPTLLTPFDAVFIDTVERLPKTENGNEYAITWSCDLPNIW